MKVVMLCLRCGFVEDREPGYGKAPTKRDAAHRRSCNAVLAIRFLQNGRITGGPRASLM